MSVLVKTVHAAIAEGKDPKLEVQRRVMNYCNTPHPSTGKAPSELIIGCLLNTKVPFTIKPATGKIHREAKEQDRRTREDRKRQRNLKRRAKTTSFVAGDHILIKQQKTTIKPPFDPKPYTVAKVKGTQITAST